MTAKHQPYGETTGPLPSRHKRPGSRRRQAIGLPADQAIALARPLLASQSGLTILHPMLRDQLAEAAANFQLSRQADLQQTDVYLAGKYPLPPVI